MIHYALINIFGWILAILFVIFSILSVRREFAPKIGNLIWIILGIATISYGVYVLSVKEILKAVFPHKHYSIGGWIAISLGLILLLSALWSQRKGKKGKES